MSTEESKHNIQKFSWKNYKTYETYEEASQSKQLLLKDTKHVKIKRSGTAGLKFTVKIGTPIKKKGEKNAAK
jgi:hypothetical protein